MEAFLALPIDGALTSPRRDVLLGAQPRAVPGNPDAARPIPTSPLGARAALRAQKDLATGGSDQPARHMGGDPGLSPEVSRAVDGIAASSEPSYERSLQRVGFVHLSDLDGDGDDILDTICSGASLRCSAHTRMALAFDTMPSDYARNDLSTPSPTPASFQFWNDACRLADPGPTVPAAILPAPALPGFGVTAFAPILLASDRCMVSAGRGRQGCAGRLAARCGAVQLRSSRPTGRTGPTC